MATLNQVSSLCHSLIEKLSTQALCILDNDAETESLNLFTFTRIIYEDQNMKSEDLNRQFKIHSKLNKMNYQENQFAWYRNRNIPSIQIKKDEDQKNQVKFNRNTPNSKKEAFTFYINACYIEKNKFAITCLKGENCLQDQNQCSFQSLKFVKTSYILNGSCVRLFIIILDSNKTIIESYISSKIHISSWKNYLKDKPSKSSIFSPFMPAVLNRTNIIQQKSKISQVAAFNNKEAGQIPIYDTIQGLSDYFKGSTIKQKVKFVIHFSQRQNLRKQSSCTFKMIQNLKQKKKKIDQNIKLSSSQTFTSTSLSQLAANKMQKKQLQKLSIRKIKGWMKNEMVQFIDNEIDILDGFILYNPDHLINMQLAYKLAYPQLEMMLINQHNFNLIQKQLRYYSQDIISEKDLISDNLYQIPKLEITLNRDFVKSDKRIFVICSQMCESSLDKQPITKQKITRSQKSSQKKQLFNLDMQNKSNNLSESQQSPLNQRCNSKQVENIQQQFDESVGHLKKKYKCLQQERISQSQFQETCRKVENIEKYQDQIIEDKVNKKLCTQYQVKQEKYLDKQDKSNKIKIVKKEENDQNQLINFNQKNNEKKINKFHNQQNGIESESHKFSQIYVKKQSEEQSNSEFVESTDFDGFNKKTSVSSYPKMKDEIKVEKFKENVTNLKYEDQIQQNTQLKTFQSEGQTDNHYYSPEYKEYDQIIYQANESSQQEQINPQYSYPNSSNIFPYYQPIQYPSSMHMVMPNPQYQYMQILPPQPVGIQPMYFQPTQQIFQAPPVNSRKYQRQ